MSNYIPYKLWDRIDYPAPNFNHCTVQVWEWISNFDPQFTRHEIIYQLLGGLKRNQPCYKMGPMKQSIISTDIAQRTMALRIILPNELDCCPVLLDQLTEAK